MAYWNTLTSNTTYWSISGANDELGVRINANNDYQCIIAELAKSTGKLYFEISIEASDNANTKIGMVPLDYDKDIPVGSDPGSFCYIGSGAYIIEDSTDSGKVVLASGNSVLGIAIDLEAGKAWLYIDGVVYGGVAPNPTTGVDPAWEDPILASGDLYPAMTMRWLDDAVDLHISASEFVYNPPTDFYAWDYVPFEIDNCYQDQTVDNVDLFVGLLDTESVYQDQISTIVNVEHDHILLSLPARHLQYAETLFIGSSIHASVIEQFAADPFAVYGDLSYINIVGDNKLSIPVLIENTYHEQYVDDPYSLEPENTYHDFISNIILLPITVNNSYIPHYVTECDLDLVMRLYTSFCNQEIESTLINLEYNPFPTIIAELELPALELQSYFGTNSTLELSCFELESEVTISLVITGNITLPSLSSNITLIETNVIDSELNIPSLELSSNILIGLLIQNENIQLESFDLSGKLYSQLIISSELELVPLDIQSILNTDVSDDLILTHSNIGDNWSIYE